MAVLLLLAALAARLLAPAGFMPAFGAQGFAIVLCSGHGPVTAMADMTMHDMGGHVPAAPEDHAKTDMPCGFSGLATPGLAGADPVLLALALLFIVATALFTRPIFCVRRVARLRPPLRGPPAGC